MTEPNEFDERDAAIPEHINENIATIAELRAWFEERTTRHQLAIERATRAVGSPRTLYGLFLFVVAWTAYNTEAQRFHLPSFDAAPFYILQGLLGFCAVCIATMVLAAQNRQSRDADQRAHLAFQVNLLAEQKTTKIISLLEELRRDLPNVGNREDPVAQALQEEVDPRAMLTALENTMDSAVITGPEKGKRSR
jgi:uncharacterized membrane protein